MAQHQSLPTAVDAHIAFVPDRRVVKIESDPPTDLSGLKGVRASSGFRQALDDSLRDEERSSSLRYQLLDDVPTAALVSGYAIGAAGVHPPPRAIPLHNHADMCAGWATGATILAEAAILGYPPIVTGPLAPPLDNAADVDAWRPLPQLPPIGMHRWRRIDAWLESDHIEVECLFRDSHVGGDGIETVVHEYTVMAALDRRFNRFLSCESTVGTLPWLECPLAAPSSRRLVGATPRDLRGWVRDTFTGTSTCTHLNDTLRSLACLPYLVSVL